ncbi:FAD-dependent oxidoreductase [Microbulbifer sp. SA54]|uniref:FAD-dependent oxidoreductase n=1 Tax=Microbulbifer sp. SA54 TaxID=3401577 RepID=UPI003AAA7330
MTEALKALSQQPLDQQTVREGGYPTYVIVGAGPVGVRCAQRLLEYSTDAQVVLIGEEGEAPYNRVRLPEYLANHVSLKELGNPVWPESTSRLAEFHSRRVCLIDRQRKVIYDDTGAPQPYTKLILATGSRPFIPEIPGATLANVIPFRNLHDTQRLLTLRTSSSRILVVGAGALGLEAAAALKTQGNRVTLLARNRLLGGKLSHAAENCLKAALLAMQVEIKTDVKLAALFGRDTVDTAELSSGERLQVDMVVLCTGITPEITLAQESGLKTGQGIQVSPHMETSDPDIYAVGECAEYQQQIYQLVKPGFDQAEICSRHICASSPTPTQTTTPVYQGSSTDIELKMADIPCALLGQTAPDAYTQMTVYRYENQFEGVCRELYMRGNSLAGATIVGAWDEKRSLQSAIAERATFSVDALEKFQREGSLWQDQNFRGIKQQPDSYLVCQCNGVNKSEICQAIAGGKRTLPDLETATGAGSVCGSCRPIIAELLDVPAPNLVMRHAREIFWVSIVALVLITATTVLPAPSLADSVQKAWVLHSLWYDNFWKQVSGYTLLGLCLMTASLSLRKRLNKRDLGHLDHWRYVHSVIGCLALVILIVHTGFRLGENLNQVLMLVFLAATCTGAMVGIFMARNHHWTDLKLREHRKWWSRVHYALLWALPVLIFYHVFAVYYF